MHNNHAKSVSPIPLRTTRSTSRLSISRIREMSLDYLEKTNKTSYTDRKITLTSTIRSEKSKKSLQINANKAYQVIKTYILPLLKEKIQNDSELSRKYLKENPSKPKVIETISYLLKKNLNQCKFKLNKLKNKLDSTIREKDKLSNELESIKLKIEEMRISSILIQDFPQLLRQSHRQPERFLDRLAVKCLQYKIAAESQLVSKLELIASINVESSSNSYLKVFGDTQKIHGNEFFFINTIIGNHLLGIYKNFSFFNSQKALMKSAFETFVYKVRERDCELGRIEFGLNEKLSNLQEFSQSIFTKAKAYSLLRKKSRILRNNYIDKITSIANDINLIYKESEDLQEMQSKKKKVFDDFKIEFDATREKINEKFGSINNRTNFVCKHCYETFKDSENYNWSCHRHPGEWSGNEYWCCGQIDKRAKGCIKSKHLAEINDGQVDIFVKKDEDIVVCLSCMQIGHNFKNCIKDPNHSIKQNRSKSQTQLKPRIKKSLNQKPFSEIETLKRTYSSNIKNYKYPN